MIVVDTDVDLIVFNICCQSYMFTSQWAVLSAIEGTVQLDGADMVSVTEGWER
jgi:hypothetical protein